MPLKLYPCAFFSRKLNAAEKNYDVGDRELLAMKAAFEEWRHWLEGATHQFTVLTDHKNLEYLRTAKRLNPRQARWSLFFTHFDFVVTYRPGSKNTKADALSRQSDPDHTPQLPETILAPVLVVAPIQWDIMTEIEANSHSEVPSVCPPNKIYVPETFRNRVLELVHSLPSSGHHGVTVFGGPPCPGMPLPTSATVPSVTPRNHPVNFQPVCSNLFLFLNGPGHT